MPTFHSLGLGRKSGCAETPWEMSLFFYEPVWLPLKILRYFALGGTLEFIFNSRCLWNFSASCSVDLYCTPDSKSTQKMRSPAETVLPGFPQSDIKWTRVPKSAFLLFCYWWKWVFLWYHSLRHLWERQKVALANTLYLGYSTFTHLPSAMGRSLQPFNDKRYSLGSMQVLTAALLQWICEFFWQLSNGTNFIGLTREEFSIEQWFITLFGL